jgi:site-specific DNA recombinase
MANTRRAGAYLRISLDREGNRLGVERQLPPIKVLLERLGWQLVEIYTDDDVSISHAGRRKRKARDAYDCMLKDAASGRIDAVAALDYTRLVRHPRDAEQLIDFANSHGIALATAAGEIDLSTATGELLFRMFGAIGAHEVRLAGERQKRRHQQKAEAGEDAGGTRSFGRADDRVTPHPTEAPIVAELATRILRGEPIYRLAAELNQRGILTPLGNRWHPSTLKRALTSARTAGLRAHNGAIVNHDAYPPLLDRETWESMRAILLDPARVGGRPAEYLLTGLAAHSSAECKATLVGNTHRGVRNYECKAGVAHRGCGRLGVRAEWLEDLVVDAVLDTLAGTGLREAISQGAPVVEDARSRQLLSQIRALETRQGQLADLHREGILDDGGHQRASASIEQRIGILRQQRKTGRPTPVLDGLPHDRPGLDRWWNDEKTTLDRKRQLLREVLERIDVKPGRRGRLEPGRVLPDGLRWRA